MFCKRGLDHFYNFDKKIGFLVTKFLSRQSNLLCIDIVEEWAGGGYVDVAVSVGDRCQARHDTFYTWYMTCDPWHMTHEMWQVIGDRYLYIFFAEFFGFLFCIGVSIQQLSMNPWPNINSYYICPEDAGGNSKLFEFR